MRHYATTDEGKRILTHLSCDAPGCEATIRPYSKISESGWTNYGESGSYHILQWNYCPEHAGLAHVRAAHGA